MMVTDRNDNNDHNEDMMLINQTIHHNRPSTRLPNNAWQQLSRNGKNQWNKFDVKLKATILQSSEKKTNTNTMIHN